ncbi:MAG: two-component system, cell cycle sensor histidine kinase and response regulator CckA [Oceanicaulis sp. HLUCCA04]|nr:MAG: two-component system, cell cycle sensor histidine kinase and response regulator CckA [Oceanicaulis sp. HLUCCA04]
MTDAPARTRKPAKKSQPDDAAETGPVSVRKASLPKERQSRVTLLARTVFWVAGLLALGAAGFSLVAASTAGWHGFVLLSGIAFVAFILMFAVAAGESAARSLRIEPVVRPKADALVSAAIDAAAEPMLVTDARGRTAWANAAYRKLAKTVMPLTAGVTLPAPDRLWPGSSGGALYRLSRAATAGQAARETLSALGESGGGVFSVSVDPVPAGGALWRFAEIRASEALDAEPGTPDWAEHAPVGLFLADGEGRVLSANATLRAWLDVPEGQALKVKDFLAGDMARSFLKTRGDKGIIRLDARLLAREGVESPITLAVEWDEGRPARARAVVYGLTAAGTPPGVAQVIAQHTGGRTGRTFDDMFASAPFGVARLEGSDPQQSIIEDANPALVQLSGGTAIPGMKFEELFDWSTGDNREDAFATAMSGRAEPVALKLKSADGSRDVHLFLSPARSGKRAAYVVDITAFRELEGQYAQAQKLKAVGELVARVAHDFNNFLTAIRLNTDNLLLRHPVGDPAYPDLQKINGVVATAAGRIKHLLAFARKQTLRVETVDLTETLADAVHLVRQSVEEWMRVEVRHGRGVPLVRIDKDELANALMNLATNARDAMAAKGRGTLTISTDRVDAAEVRAAGAPDVKDGAWAAIHIADEGCGMDADTLAKIFEPFFTTKEAGKGTGLGLATVYGIVKQSSGFLFARSTPGEGTTFSIYLPEHIPDADEIARTETRKAEVPVQRKPADQAGRGRILLVEDEAPVRSITALTLKNRGYEVDEAEDGEEALAILEERPGGFDLIISDVVMPGLDGPGLLKAAADYLGDARIIFISGYAEEHFSHTLSDDLDISFLPKPFSLEALAQRVKDELGR